MSVTPGVTYWDTSAIVSVLFCDDRSEIATTFARSAGTHVMSSLAWAETHAVIARIDRERVVSKTIIDAAYHMLESGPWRQLSFDPDRKIVARLARAWPLRGADLWHLATAKDLQFEIPELTFLSYDHQLVAAAVGEGLHPPS